MKQIFMNITNCPLCGSDNFESKSVIKDFALSQEDFTVVECAACRLLFTNPRPDNEKIGDYYKSSSYISHTNQSKGLFGFVYQVLRNRALALKRGWILRHAEPGKLLDYGSGTGEFLYNMQAHGWYVKGVEIAEGPRIQSQKKYGLDVLDPEEFQNEQASFYDLITMWHVLEHIDNLAESAERIISKLKPGGILVLALPNPESWDAKYYKDYWAAWDVPIHFYHFKKENINALASKIGLELVETINMPFDSFYVSLLSEQYKTGSKSWIKAFMIGLFSNLKAGKNNASSLTYILRKL